MSDYTSMAIPPSGKKRVDMNKEILRLAIPNIISNISVPLLSSVDTALMGRMSAAHLGAVGLGAMIFNFIYWNFGFLRMGTTGLTAQAYGRSDERALVDTLGRAVVLGLAIALVLLLFQGGIAKGSIWALQVSAGQGDLVGEYFSIRIWAAPATLLSYAFMGWFFGMQQAVYPLIWVLVVNGANILLSFYFVRELDMGIRGVAWGTVAAQYIGLGIGMLLLGYRYGGMRRMLSLRGILDGRSFSHFLSINRDIFLRTLLLTFSFALFYNRSSVSGSLVLAANVVLLQFVNWMSYGIDGFAYASESLVGKYVGAADRERFNRAVRLTFAWGMGLAVAYALAYGVWGEAMLRIFTDQEAVLAVALDYWVWMVAFPVLSTPCYLYDGIFIGLTASKAMRNSMLIAFGVFLGLVFSVGQYWGNHGLWLSLLLFMIMRGLVQGILFRSGAWDLR